MKPIVFIPGICMMFLFFSCEKTYAPGDISGGTVTGAVNGNGTGLQLTKIVSTGYINETQTIGYDASGRVSGTYDSAVQGGTTSVIRYAVTRNSSGKIFQVLMSQLVGGTLTTITGNVHYPSGSADFDYSVSSYPVSGLVVTDSVVYGYTAGKVTDEYDYQSITGLTQGYALSSHMQYTYDNSGNVVTVKVYAPSQTAGTLQLYTTITYEYDSKTAPLQMGNEAFLLNGDVGLASRNNGVKGTFTDNTAATASITNTLQYNSKNLPITGVSVQVPGNNTSNLQYFYQ